MFFDLILLNFQHGGRLGIAWLAATRGPRFIKKKDIEKIDLVKLCDDLKLFIATCSTDPKKRFSLRLSAILTNGVIKIFKEQALILQGEIFTLITRTVKMTATIRLSADDVSRTGIFETPPTPIPTIKKKRTRKAIVETPEDIVQQTNEAVLHLPDVEDVFRLTARADEITIREEMPKRTDIIEDDLSLGIRTGKEIEEEMQLLFAKYRPPVTSKPQLPSHSSDSLPVQGQIEVVAQVHAPGDGYIELPQSQPSEPLPPQSVIEVVAQVHAPREGYIEAEQTPAAISVEPTIEASTIIPPPPPVAEVAKKRTPKEKLSVIEDVRQLAEAPAIQIAHIVSDSENIPPGTAAKATVDTEIATKARKRQRKPLTELQVEEIPKSTRLSQKQKELLMYRPISRKFVRIIRCNENEDQFVNEDYPLPVPCKTLATEELYNLFWVENIVDVQIRQASTLQSLSTGGSLDLRKTDSAHVSTAESITDTAVRQSIQPENVIPELISSEAEKEAYDKVKQVSIEAPVISTPSPRKRKRLAADRKLPRSSEDGLGRRRELMDTTPHTDEILTGVAELPQQLEDFEQCKETPSEPILVPDQLTLQQTVVEVQPMDTFPDISEIREPSKADYKIRQQAIINIVMNWTPGQGIITIEDVCEKPINRLTIARAFSDLLTLSRSGYVNLISEVDSIELKCIEKGPKFKN